MAVFSPKLAFKYRYELSERFVPIQHLLSELNNGEDVADCEDCDNGKISIVIYNYIIDRISLGDIKDTKFVASVMLNNHSDIIFIVDGVPYSSERIIDECFFCKEKEMPGIFTSIKNVVKSFIHIFYKLFTKGDFFVDKKTLNKRLKTCRSCDYYCPKSKKCTVCTCPVERKVKFKHSSCPEDEWEN
jgi:hypothetical protein